MLLGLFAALAASVCYGVATVLQAVSARAAPHTADVDPRLLLRLSRQVPFVTGLALDVVGFGLQFFALRLVPIFLRSEERRVGKEWRCAGAAVDAKQPS